MGKYFDELAREGLFAAFDDEESDRVRFFMTQWRVQRGERILEPGCGQGRLTALLAGAVGPEGEVFAVDVSRAMIRQARARALPSQATFAVRSVYALPQPDAWFDQVVCFNVFPHSYARRMPSRKWRVP
ncbi:class I SAM-dependent methyltransferase [bacterium]|nr:class I SAM-dependent methyltransferase [bacterium]